MPRKAPRRANKTKRPARPTRSGPARNRQGAGVVAGGILFSILALLVKGIALLIPSKAQLAAFWAKPWARKTTFATLALVACLVTLSSLKNNLRDDPRYQIDPAGVEITAGKLSWLNDAGSEALLTRIQEDLAAELGELGTRDAFDDELLAEAAKCIQANPWVAEVIRVSRTFPTDSKGARLSAEISLRKPVLRVLLGDTIYLVDREGVALPLEVKANAQWQPQEEATRKLYNAIERDAKVRFVTNVTGPRPLAGKPWENEQIVAALSMEKTLRANQVGAILPISQIDVADISNRKDFRGQPVYTANGGVVLYPSTSKTKIIWGKAEVHAGSFEPSVADKLAKLKSQVAIDASLATLDELRLNVNG